MPARAQVASVSLALGAALVGLLAAARAGAVPGPDSVAIVANARVPESVALAERYRDARAVPARQLCALDLADTADVPLAELRAALIEPLRACLGEALPRIEAVLLVRGVPLRVDVGAAEGCGRASVAAALGAGESTLADGTPLLGHAPGRTMTCAGGSSCCGAAWPNPFRAGVFDAGWERESGGVTWRPLLVTMLHGRSYEDAARLLDSALAAEAAGPPGGQLLFMDGADPARGSLDATYDAVIAGLRERGFADVARVPFDRDLTGRTLGAFFVGTASLGTTIEGNTFVPGAIVDNLTSFGARPENFAADGEVQVSIARWVARGVAGVHGTTDEPLANSFPARRLLLDYVDGATLAEAYLRNMPFAYWQNLVLGDPMAAPYATRPTVSFEGVADGDRVTGSRAITVRASDPAGRGVARLRLLVDGVEVASSAGEPLSLCLAPAPGAAVHLLAVAQTADDGSDVGLHQPKGWSALHLEVVPGDRTCSALDAGAPPSGDAGPPAPDAALPAGDGGAVDAAPPGDGGPRADGAEPSDAAHGGAGEGGCGCVIARRERAAAVRVGPIALLLVLALSRGRRRRRHREPRR